MGVRLSNPIASPDPLMTIAFWKIFWEQIVAPLVRIVVQKRGILTDIIIRVILIIQICLGGNLRTGLVRTMIVVVIVVAVAVAVAVVEQKRDGIQHLITAAKTTGGKTL
jgi:hypothetical protein